MTLSSNQRALYLLGGYVETSSSPVQDLPVSFQTPCTFLLTVFFNVQCSFYLYSIDSNKWHLLSLDTHKEGGPHMIYDHQVSHVGTEYLYTLIL